MIDGDILLYAAVHSVVMGRVPAYAGHWTYMLQPRWLQLCRFKTIYRATVEKNPPIAVQSNVARSSVINLGSFLVTAVLITSNSVL